MLSDVKKRQVLSDLDKHAAEFNFPVLDNAYVEFAAARLSAFRSDPDWLILFEVLGFSTKEVQFVDDIYAYGSCLDREGFIGEEIPFVACADTPFFDPETNECIMDRSCWCIELRGQKLWFSPSREEYGRADIRVAKEPGPGSLREIELLRYLVHARGEDLFLNTENLLRQFPRCGLLQLFIQTSHWQHPDVAGGEIPSENISIVSLIDALSSGDPLLFKKGRSNTHWSFWARKPK